MVSRSQSPLAMLVQKSLEALAARTSDSFQPQAAQSFGQTFESIAGGLLVSMGYREIAEDISLEAVALLGAATVAGLKVVQAAEPGLYKLEDALYAFEDLLRRTAPAKV